MSYSETQTQTQTETQTTPAVTTHEIADLQVMLTNPFLVGTPKTENEVRILYAAKVRQFTNNQNALAKARKEGKNKTAQPDAAELATLFSVYEQTIGDEPRQSVLERMHDEAVWRVWSGVIAAHNKNIGPYIKAVADGKDREAARYLAHCWPAAARKGVEMSTTFKKTPARKLEDGTVIPEITAQQHKENTIAKVATFKVLQAKIEAELAKIKAEKGKDKPVSTIAVYTGDDVLVEDVAE